MEMHDLLKKISELSTLTESKKETTHKGGTKTTTDDEKVTKHKGKYGTEFQGDDEEDDEDAKKAKKAKVKAADAPKRGRGRPKKNADASGNVPQYKNAASLQSFMVGNLPGGKAPGKKGTEYGLSANEKQKKKDEKAKAKAKKSSLKEWFDEVDAILEATTTTNTITPGATSGQQFKVVNNPGGSKEVVDTKTGFTREYPPNVANQASIDATKMNAQAQKDASTSGTTGTEQTNEETMEEGGKSKKWISGAIKKPGAFTKKAKAAGKDTGEFAAHVLSNKEKFPAKTEKQAVLAKTLSKLSKGKTKKEGVEEAEMPSRDGAMSPLTLGGKIEETPKKTASKKTAKGSWKNSFHEGKKAKPDYLDLDDDGNKKESMKSAAASAKKKRTVKEAGDSCRAAYHEGKCHAFENGHYRCRYDEGMQEREHYHRGFLEGLEEAYGGSKMDEAMMPRRPGRNLPTQDVLNKRDIQAHRDPRGVLMNPDAADNLIYGKTLSKVLKRDPEYTDMDHDPFPIGGPKGRLPEGEMDEGKMFHGKPDVDTVEPFKRPPPGTSKAAHRQSGIPGSEIPTGPTTIGDKIRGIGRGLKGFITGGPEPTNEGELEEEMFLQELDALEETGMEMDTSEGYDASLDEMDKTEWMKHKARTTKGDTFKAFGQTMHDKDVLEDGMNDLDISEDPMMESWARELNQLLREDGTTNKPTVAEGLTVTTSMGQPHGSDSVSISATDADAQKLMQMLSNAGMRVGLGSLSGAAQHGDETADYRDEGSAAHDSEEVAPIMARPRGYGFSQNVDSEECDVVEPYDYDEVSSALGAGGSAMSALRRKLLALESKSGLAMPDGNGMSVQSVEDEPHDTPDSIEPYDFEEVQGALESGGKKISVDKPAKKSGDTSESKEELEESFPDLAMPPGKGMSKQSVEPQPKAPKSTKIKTEYENSKHKKSVKESSVPVLASPAGFGMSTPSKTEPGDVKVAVARHSDDIQGALERGQSKTSVAKTTVKGGKVHPDGVTDKDSVLKKLGNPDDAHDNEKFGELESMHRKNLEETALAMPDGKGFSTQAKDTPMPDGPVDDVTVTDLDDVLGDLEEKDTYQQDEYERAFSQLKRMIGSQLGTESKSESAPKTASSESEHDHDDEEELKEGATRCDECGAMYEGTADDHQCEESAEKLDEWSNSLRGKKDPGQIAEESFAADTEYMMNSISGGLDKKKVQRSHGYRNGDNPLGMSVNGDPLADWMKLSGISK